MVFSPTTDAAAPWAKKCEFLKIKKGRFSPCWYIFLEKAFLCRCGVFYPQHVRQQHAKSAMQKW
jgi:hypothetical protein